MAHFGMLYTLVSESNGTISCSIALQLHFHFIVIESQKQYFEIGFSSYTFSYLICSVVKM